MSDLFPPWPLFSAFFLASLLLALSPGPGVLYIVTRSLVQGRRSGLVSVAGIALGNLANAALAAVGLGAVFALSTHAFLAVKYAGAIYLIYLGLRMLRAPDASPAQSVQAPPPGRVFRDGLVVALLNPKTTLFFAAFLPQFLRPDAAPLGQSLLLGAIFVALAACTDSLYALGAGALAPRFRGGGAARLGRRLGGTLFVGLGLFTAFSGAHGE
ncbi:MAG: threonine transporter [Candidatus Sedimenticola endophacoides]|uniref:LysE family translocator n=1 Tax=Candidatus Sedimenticola endophacoides TaxID=2548426 RepID=A0A657PVH6_9GAMM|nr:MAG: threonine transporter [Candidatus Sedimenticola endophacoides]OQX32745.1 MAG: threonine transporter [Candidatus Sedimenticola endophacoides]OQX41546.1 MAG: threonine transporter [Candidatus Sedimenticola endophacoides]OQX42541.1 MAG: threonine transporter [Candidatus Sedimenticola endophacoides]OQX44049.1 MAG: threonine transporter [Candidatus Sedimenticola endophacoides]